MPPPPPVFVREEKVVQKDGHPKVNRYVLSILHPRTYTGRLAWASTVLDPQHYARILKPDYNHERERKALWHHGQGAPHSTIAPVSRIPPCGICPSPPEETISAYAAGDPTGKTGDAAWWFFGRPPVKQRSGGIHGGLER